MVWVVERTGVVASFKLEKLQGSSELGSDGGVGAIVLHEEVHSGDDYFS